MQWSGAVRAIVFVQVQVRDAICYWKFERFRPMFGIFFVQLLVRKEQCYYTCNCLALWFHNFTYWCRYETHSIIAKCIGLVQSMHFCHTSASIRRCQSLLNVTVRRHEFLMFDTRTGPTRNWPPQNVSINSHAWRMCRTGSKTNGIIRDRR